MNSVLVHQQNDPITSDQLLNNALQVAIDRNQNLNIFMRNFADLVKLPEANKKQIDLISLVKSVAELMLFSAKEKQVKIELVLPNEPYYIHADAQLLEQALINIMKNAMEAIGLQGLITLSLNPVKHQLIITDNGAGIAKGHAGQLFSPFFSTKKDGQGIGLTLVREILLNHGFEFSLNTESGLTKFSIML
ncbi:Sensor protein FixL [compost metagenome]